MLAEITTEIFPAYCRRVGDENIARVVRSIESNEEPDVALPSGGENNDWVFAIEIVVAAMKMATAFAALYSTLKKQKNEDPTKESLLSEFDKQPNKVSNAIVLEKKQLIAEQVILYSKPQ